MEALHDVVKVGKARYIGASSMWAWQFKLSMQHVAELQRLDQVCVHAGPAVLSSSGRRNAKMHRLPARATGVGVIPWNRPLARGNLT